MIYKMDHKTQHIVILILSLVFLALCIAALVMKKKEHYTYVNTPYQPIISDMNTVAVENARSNQQCQEALNAYCPVRNQQLQGQLGPSNLSAVALPVLRNCGNDFPADKVCAQNDPNFGMSVNVDLIGGTHEDKYGTV